MIYIKNIPKDLLLYELWKHAKLSHYLLHCNNLAPLLTLKDARYAINNMIANNDLISVCTFYGRMIYVDITDDYLDSYNYDMHNGKNAAKKIVDKLKLDQLSQCVIRYYLHH